MKCAAVSPTQPRVRPMRADRAILIYDGDCGFCRQTVAMVSKWDREGRLTLIPFQDQARVAAFRIPLPALAAAMHLVLPDGRVLAGADAAADLLRLLPGKRWLAGIFALPGVLPLARHVYRWIARQRHCLVRGVAPE